MRPDEGLNELGEAPPAYMGKRSTGDEAGALGDANRGLDDAGTSIELRDLEAGVPPPDYTAVPPPAVTTDSRRT